MTDDYNALLNRAKEKIPEELAQTERLEIPKVKGHVQGTKTIIVNLLQIAKITDRDPAHLLKFLLKELATAGETKGQNTTFNNKIPSKKLNEKIEKYTKLFVICKECGKPETKLIKEDGINQIKCNACGAKYTIHYRL